MSLIERKSIPVFKNKNVRSKVSEYVKKESQSAYKSYKQQVKMLDFEKI